MTKEQKIKALETAMTQSERDGNKDDTFYHFLDNAPEELKDLYLEHYNVRDLDYQIFSEACDLVSECYHDNDANNDGANFVEDMIYERASDKASVYTADRLAYLSMHNEDEVSEIMREYSEPSIATACAIWYDKQVEQASIIIHQWINA